jgi:Putative Actinobacterial Holin-X, holin superfamily III
VSNGRNALDPDGGSGAEARLGGSAQGPGSEGSASGAQPASSPAATTASQGTAGAVRDQSTASAGQGVATTITEISERATLLIHEEIELAKAEVVEKLTSLARGAAVGVAAGIFVVTALFFTLVGLAWLLYYYLPIGTDFTYFVGFFAMALILLILGLIAGLIAARVLRRGAPPTPDMAIEEARRIRETVSSSGEASGREVS